MNAEERAHIESLLQIHRAHLRELELKAAKYGNLDVPTHVTLQITEYHQKIAELEERMQAGLPRHNLPPRDYEQFIGRHKELAEIRRLLGPKSRAFLVTIDGIGGIGKSALALETAYTFHDQYSTLPEPERFEAIVWVSAKRSYLTADGILERRQTFRTLNDLYAAIAQVLDFPAITRVKAEEQRAIVEDVLREQRTLLILDNLETVDDEELLSFLHELPDPTKTLVTTRHRIDVARPVRLTGMPHGDALSLIVQETERKEVVLTAEEQESLWQRTGGVPLAIVWSIGLMGVGASVESVLRRLGSGQSDIARFCFEESVARIRGRDAYWLVLALALFVTDASREALGVVAGLGEDETGCEQGLEKLLRLSLVNKEGDRFSILPLARNFITSEVQLHQLWTQKASERMYSHLYEQAKQHGGWSKNWTGHDRVERELINILGAIDNLAASIQYQQIEDGENLIAPSSQIDARLIVNFINATAQTLQLRGYWVEAERLCRLAISVSRALSSATKESADLEQHGWSCYQLSKYFFSVSDAESMEQYGQRAVKVGQQTGAKRLELLGLRQRASAALIRNDVTEADKLINKAVDFLKYHQLEQRIWRHLYGLLGRVAERKGDHNTALDWFQRSVASFEELNDLPNWAPQLLNLGRAKFALNDLEGARSCYEHGLALARECKRPDAIAQALFHIARLDHSCNHYDAVEIHTRQALDLFRRLGMKREQAEAEALLARLELESPRS